MNKAGLTAGAGEGVPTGVAPAQPRALQRGHSRGLREPQGSLEGPASIQMI